MFKKIKNLLIGLLLILAALWLLLGGRATSDISVLDRLPDHDYIAEINDLMKQQRWGEAKTLCEDVIAYLNNGEVEAQVCPGWLRGDKWHLLVGDEDCHTSWGLGAVTHWQPMPQPPKGE